MKAIAYVCLATILCGGLATPAEAQSGPKGSDERAQSARIAALSTRLQKLHTAGKVSEALAAAQELLELRRAHLGPKHVDVADTLSKLGALYSELGEHQQSQRLQEEAIATIESTLGPYHVALAMPLGNLGHVHLVQGQLEQAQAAMERSAALQEREHGPHHPDVATALNNLAAIHHQRGAYDQAIAVMERALTIFDQTDGPEPAQPASASVTLLRNLSEAYAGSNQLDRALSLMKRCLATAEERLGDRHLETAVALNGLGALHLQRLEYEKSRPVLERAVAILKNLREAGAAHLGTALGNLASAHRGLGEHEQALSLLRRALVHDEASLGASNHQVAIRRNNLATHYLELGYHERASQLLARVAGTLEHSLGARHDKVAVALNNRAWAQAARREVDAALASFERALAIEQYALRELLRDSSEHRRSQRIGKVAGNLFRRISLHLGAASHLPSAGRLALETIWLAKGRRIETVAETMRLAHRDTQPGTRDLLAKLTETHAALSGLYRRGPGASEAEHARYRRTLLALESEKEQLEAELATRNDSYRRAAAPMTVAALQERLPADAALLEFAVYRPFDFHATGDAIRTDAWGPQRYAAYVIASTGRVRGIDLGPAAAIDAAVARFRESAGQHLDDADTRGRELYKLIFEPVEHLLDDTRRVHVAPGGQLGSVPFAALVADDGRYLLERYLFTYLTSGRELILRTAAARPMRKTPGTAVIVADPDFDTAGVGAAEARRADLPEVSRLRPVSSLQSVQPLADTVQEARAVAEMLPGATLLTGRDATEATVRTMDAPAILHLATHGFFLPEQAHQAQTQGGAERASQPVVSASVDSFGLPLPRAPLDSGLLRSGLVLAGANRRQATDGGDDGLLTALEVALMNLTGTRLVVLSACDTGIATPGANEALYGLRRAFAIAGAETLVMSLWRVDDRVTRRLMRAYYQHLAAGQGRSEAMQSAQRTLVRAGGPDAHPFYWGSFVVSGHDSPLSAQVVQRPAPPRAGCASCASTPPSRHSWPSLALLLGIAIAGVRLTLRRRRRGRSS